MTPPWMNALDTQLHILRFWQSPAGAQYAKGFMESWDGGNSQTQRHEWIRRTGEFMCERGETYWVSPDMMTLNLSTCDGVPGHPLRRHDLMSQHGFVVLPRPFYFTDARGKKVGYRAFGWTTGVRDITVDEEGGVVIYFYARKGDCEDDNDPLIQKHGHLWDLLHFQMLPFESADWDDIEHWRAAGLSEETIYESMRALKFVVAFWARIKEEILKKSPTVVTRQGWIDRHTGKRAKRAKFKLPEHIRVVTLRREYDPSGRQREKRSEEEGLYYTHRFKVRAHWRWQYYPSRNCHERIPIDEYVKGPEDAPFIDKDVVNKWSR